MKNFSLIFFIFISCSVHSQNLESLQDKAETEQDTSIGPDVAELKQVGRLLVDDLLNRKDLMWYNSKRFTGFHYAEAVTVYGALQFSDKIKDKQRLKQLQKKYRNIPDFDTLAAYHHVDGSVIGIVPLEIYKTTGKNALKTQGLELADAQWQKPLANGMTSQSRYWIDDIYMINAIQMQAYRVTGDKNYLNRAALNTREYLKKIQQENGLFWHGPEAPFFWGRGNGWVAAGVAELLTELPSTHPDFAVISASYKKMMKSLISLQSGNGMWRQLITNPDSWQESSATAMFAWAMLIGVQSGILESDTYKPAVIKAWYGLREQVSNNGKIKNICVGTGQSKKESYYLERPTVEGDFHGQAPMLWLITALLQEQGSGTD